MLVARNKIETMCFESDNMSLDKASLITLGEEKVKNVPSFKYLGHLITSDQKTYTIGHKIGSAWECWSHLKHIFLDKEISLSIRVQILESTVRTRLTYVLQAKLLTTKRKC